MNHLKPHLSEEQQAKLCDVLQKIDLSKFAKLTNFDRNYLYDLFVSLPHKDRTSDGLVGARLGLALAVLQAADRAETQETIKNSPSLCALVETLRVTVALLGRGCEK